MQDLIEFQYIPLVHSTTHFALIAITLVDDLKYDLRIYVMVYGLNPLRIYLHEQGIARFATEPYIAPKASNLNNLYMHLTNYAINKNNSAFM